ncbi:hematopoietic prostaglandin D synthase-like isoform X2 [Bombus huntii]|nr:hematopoietic prostaglandin D synthase-like [Bombus huntii]XP_050495888.1 hematopoietic prostaglandin D synthase-like [Bombus huntii]XP_050495889.1 hematopoietic prostaglandin D synthase-like [Bombus huntii]XP_050496151.1 hematopoietic prostaglandin D synthase-like isoform X2 [Bombus huntii]
MSDEHTYKLIYFNARGRAEHIRYIFAYTGIEYTDERIPEELWPEYKDCKREESIFTFIVQLSAMPYKKLPVLEVDGKPVAQGNAVAPYLARKYDLMGNCKGDALICEVLVDTLEDLEQDDMGGLRICSGP